MIAQHAVFGAILACSVYLTLTYGAYLALTAVGVLENARRRREHAFEDYATQATTRFASPVSIVLAAYNERATIEAAVRSLLSIDYAQFEVIVVSDGSTDGTLELLVDRYGLEPVDIAIRDTLPTERVRAFYRSLDHPSLTVVDKDNGGKADALNLGLNLCRYRYICGVDADTVFSADALVKAMRVCAADPERVVGVTSYVEIGENPERTMGEPIGRRSITARPLMVAFQTLDYLRAFFNNRIAWSRHDFMLCSIGAFQVWRRDVVTDLGGWSRDFTCEDIELTFRVHEVLLREQRDFKVICLPDPVAATEGPNTVRKLVAQRERWQRVTLETWWAYRHMCFRRRYANVGMLGMPFYLLSEVLAPVFEVTTFLTIGTGIALGIMDWWLFLWVAMLIALVNGVFNAAAVYAVDRQAHEYSYGSLARLFGLAPLELLIYRPVITWARVKGTWRFFRGDKSWHKFDRNAPLGDPA